MRFQRNSMTARVLRLMADGKPRSLREMAYELGVEFEQVQSVTRHARDLFDMVPPPVPTYTIAAGGLARLAVTDTPRPKKPRKYKPTGRPRGRPPRVVADQPEPVEQDQPMSPHSSEAIVRMGIQSRTALDLAWRAAA